MRDCELGSDVVRSLVPLKEWSNQICPSLSALFDFVLINMIQHSIITVGSQKGTGKRYVKSTKNAMVRCNECFLGGLELAVPGKKGTCCRLKTSSCIVGNVNIVIRSSSVFEVDIFREYSEISQRRGMHETEWLQ